MRRTRCTIALLTVLGLWACQEDKPAETGPDTTAPGADVSEADTAGADTAPAADTQAQDTRVQELPDYSSLYPLDGILRVHHLQARGTHNSYHVEPAQPADDSHRYTHAPLGEGLGRLGLRQFEIDIHFDRSEDAFVVFHLPILDEESTCYLFTTCLQQIKDWSDSNPGHHPIFIWIEPKDDADFIDNRFLPITDYDALDGEIRAVWPEHRLLTPDDVQGEAASLREAVEKAGWPTLDKARDSVIIALLDTDHHGQNYTRDWTSLAGRAMFVNARSLDDPLAAVIKINDPRSTAAIEAALARNFLVGSNVDGVADPDDENAAGLAAALAVGVHFLSSDLPESVGSRTYHLEIPDGTPSRCNPVTAPPECTSEGLEKLP